MVEVTGLVLAGGAARRLQAAHPGADKGLLPLAGRPLAAWLIDNLAPQTSSLLISANRHLDTYRQLGYPVLADHFPDLPGPLAGIHAALQVCPTEWLAVAACDTPFLPPDWVARLLADTVPAAAIPAPSQHGSPVVTAASGFQARDPACATAPRTGHPASPAKPSRIAPVVYASDPEQPHPLVAVLHRRVLPSLEAFLQGGNHRVRQWYGGQGAHTVRFDEPNAFMNLNTPEAWQQAEARLARGRAWHASVHPPY